jgi:hypothetical protein
MSTIALVTVGSNDHNAMQQALPDSGPATTAFADLLDDTREPKQKTHKAEMTHPVYSFAELGMFGLHELVLPPDPRPNTAPPSEGGVKLAAVTHTAATPESTAPEPAEAPPLVSVPFLQTEPEAGNTVMGVTPPAGGSKGSAGTIGGIRSFAGGTVIDLVKPERQNAPPPAAQSAKAQMRQTPAKAADPVSVTVSGPDQALAIAVRSGGEPGTEVTKLRRLIETTVASFEMDIAQLHVNGAAVEDVFSLGGGMNGGSAR